MRVWAETQVWELCCEAALLPDEAAIAFLCQQLEAHPSNTGGYGALLSALAWLDVERALQYYDDSFEEVRHVYPRSYLEAYQEALELQRSGDEHIAAYRAIIALLPDRGSETLKRQQALGFLCARQSPQQFIGSENWEFCLNYLIFTRLYLAFPEHFQDWSQARMARARSWEVFFWSIAQTLLRIQKEEGYIPRLVALVEKRCQSKIPLGDDMDAKAVYSTLCLLETQAPEEVHRLVPGVINIFCKGRGYSATAMLAYVLILIARLDLNVALLCPVRDKLHSIGNFKMGQYWMRQVRRFLLELTSEPQAALRLLRVFRLYVIVRRIEQILSTQSNKEPAQKQRQRDRRWLTRSQRFIDSVEFPFWQNQLQKKKNALSQPRLKSKSK